MIKSEDQVSDADMCQLTLYQGVTSKIPKKHEEERKEK